MTVGRSEKAVNDITVALMHTVKVQNSKSFFRVPGMEAMIYCKDGQCKFVNPNDVVVNQNEEEDNSSINQVKHVLPLNRPTSLQSALITSEN